jgi:hypothetical protein
MVYTASSGSDILCSSTEMLPTHTAPNLAYLCLRVPFILIVQSRCHDVPPGPPSDDVRIRHGPPVLPNTPQNLKASPPQGYEPAISQSLKEFGLVLLS